MMGVTCTLSPPRKSHFALGLFCRCVKFINPLKPSGNYVPPALIINNSLILITDCIYGFRIILRVNSDYFHNHLIFLMVTRCVFFAVRTELLNIIQTSFYFKRLKVNLRFFNKFTIVTCYSRLHFKVNTS
jgi:hypothetical protein